MQLFKQALLFLNTNCQADRIMKPVLTFIILLFWLSAVGQSQKEIYLKKLENDLHPQNLKSVYLDYNFSTLIIPKDDFLGYIGSNFQRIKIFYTSVIKNSENPDTYNIEGISIVGNNKCYFKGSVTIEQIREFKSMQLGVDLMYENAGFQAQGVMIASYEYDENPNQSHVGRFKGIMTVNWLIDKHGILHLNDIDDYSDNYRNNQHIGTWSEYGSAENKTCNWGIRRIPFSEDLDIGAGEFSANPKYKDKGWEFYRPF